MGECSGGSAEIQPQVMKAQHTVVTAGEEMQVIWALFREKEEHLIFP